MRHAQILPADPVDPWVISKDTGAEIGFLEVAFGASARVVTHPTELPFGERVARVRDPQGHLWWIHQHLEDVDAADLAPRFADPAAFDLVTMAHLLSWMHRAGGSVRSIRVRVRTAQGRR